MHPKRVHCVGIGGIGVSALAQFFHVQGARVSGSDLKASEITRDLEGKGISIYIGHGLAPLDDIDCLIYSGAVNQGNPELRLAKERHIPVYSYFEMLGLLSKDKDTIAVCGTHGKSTTTALLGLILESASFDPTVIVGSKVKNFPYGNLREGKSNWWVVEACEHMANILLLSPKFVVLTNIEEDHLDYYKDIAHIRETFQKFMAKIPRDGFLVMNADDPESSKLQIEGRIVSYGLKTSANYMARNIRVEHSPEPRMVFDLWRTIDHEKILGTLRLRIPGRMNVSNALAAIAGALSLTAPLPTIKEAVEEFSGIWRRFERISLDPLIISDYAHHPTAVRETLEAARSFYPGRRLLVVFQPHQRDRTKKFFTQFIESFDKADSLIVSEIFEVAGREKSADQTISSQDLVKKIRLTDEKMGRQREIIFAATLDDTAKSIKNIYKKQDVILVMGAGDIYTLSTFL